MSLAVKRLKFQSVLKLDLSENHQHKHVQVPQTMKVLLVCQAVPWII